MITSYHYDDFGKYNVTNYSKVIFKDPLFKLIGYIDLENFIVFHTDHYLHYEFLRYSYYKYRLMDYIDLSNLNYLKSQKYKIIFIPDIFKSTIDINRISFNIDNSSLKIFVKKMEAAPELYINIVSSIPLNLKFIQNLRIEKERIIKIETKIESLNYSKKVRLSDFYISKRGGFKELTIKSNRLTDNLKFLNLFDNYYNYDKEFDNGSVVNLIEAILRNIPVGGTIFKNEICVPHNGINLKIYKSRSSWLKSMKSSYCFTNFDQEIDLNKAINFLKMTPNFETFLYQLEKIHLSKV